MEIKCDTKEAIINHYVKEVDTYEFMRFENPKYPSNLRLRRKIEEVCKKYLVGKSVLEIACGTGYWANFFSPLGFQYSGIDITPAMIEKANEKGLDTCKVGMAEDPFAYQKDMDNIVCIKAFTMFQDQQAVLNNIYDSLRPGGRFLVFYNNKWNILPLIYSLLVGGSRKLGLSSTYDNPISRTKFLKMLDKAGLNKLLVGECCNIPFRFLPRWRWLDRVDDLLAFGWITYVVAERKKLDIE